MNQIDQIKAEIEKRLRANGAFDEAGDRRTGFIH